MDKMVFGLAAVCFAGFAVFFIQNILQNYYRYDHWNAPDLKTTLVNALGLLFVPGRLIARGEGIVIHQILLFSSLIFFGGGIFRLISTLKNGDAREKDKIIILAASYCLPFLFYGIVGSVLPKFGHSRNFFYLLPVYILIVFLGLSFIKKPALRHWLSGIGVVLMVVNTMGQTCPLLKQEYVQRAAIRHAAEMDADLVFTPWNLQGFSAASDWSFLYYLKRHHATEKLIPWKNEYLNIPERDIPKTLQDKLRTGKIVYFKPQGESVPNFEEDGRFKRYPRLDMEGYFGPYETLQKRFFKKSRFKAFILNNQAFPNI